MKYSECIVLIIVSAIFFSCRKPYQPNVAATNTNYLVVEGVINTGSDSTIIKLSRTLPLTSPASSQPELGATLNIISSSNDSYPLTSIGNGIYVSVGLNLNASNKYQLKIITSDGKIYQSDFISAKLAPPIDSVHYKINTGDTPGVQIYANAHDPSNNTIYYRWDYIETYIIHPLYQSYYIVERSPQDTIVPRLPNQQIYTCWVTNTSSDVILGSSASLTKDVINNAPIAFVSATTDKMAVEYSILIKQYALTKDAFEYWQQLKKNTEQLGSIFDAQPSELPGNIHCVTNPSEQVIGYISAGTYTQKRIFVDNRYLPIWLRQPYSGECTLNSEYYADPVSHGNDVQLNIYNGFEVPVNPITIPGHPHPIGWTAADPDCVDCRFRGTNIQPSYWIYF